MVDTSPQEAHPPAPQANAPTEPTQLPVAVPKKAEDKPLKPRKMTWTHLLIGVSVLVALIVIVMVKYAGDSQEADSSVPSVRRYYLK